MIKYFVQRRISLNKPYKKMFSPLVFDLVNKRLVPMNNFEREINLIPGFINGQENYGFIVIVKKDGKVGFEEYGTEERICAGGIEGEFLLVYEDGKKYPWRLKTDGSLVEEAIFNPRLISDSEYYKEHYGETLAKERTL